MSGGGSSEIILRDLRVSGRPDFDPNKAMQSEIAAALDGEIALPRKQRDALNEQKTALMQKLLTGEVRLKEFRE